MNYVEAFTCIKNEKRCYLEEWVAYHYFLGIEHFTFYNGGEPLDPLPHSTIIDWPGTAQQLPCLRDFCFTRKPCRWGAMFDVDEFIVPHAWSTIPDMLACYEEFGGLCINWLDFGSNGQPDDERPQVEKFTRRSLPSFNLNRHLKSIAQLERTADIVQSHCFRYKPGYYAVNTDRQAVTGPFGPVVIDKAQLNHYYFRSKPEWDRKVWTPGPCGGRRTYDEWIHEPECNAVEDLSALNIWREMAGDRRAAGTQGSIYQLAVRPSQPISPVYTVLQMEEQPEIHARYPDPVLRANLSERVGMWYVWKHRQHDWVGFTSENQLRKCGVVFHPGDIERRLETADVVVWGWVDLDVHVNGWTVEAQAEYCHPGFSQATRLIGLDVPRLTAGAYCNYFAMRWDLFDAFMRWSEPFVERLAAHADNPVLGKRAIAAGAEGKDRHTPLGAIQERLFTIWLGQSGLRICKE